MNERWLTVSIVVSRVKSVLRDVHVELELLLNHNGSKNYGDDGSSWVCRMT